jgi:hypothetical protein
MIACRFDGSHLASQLRHLRTPEQLGNTPLVAICARENHICILPPSSADLCRPAILLYSEVTTDEQLRVVMLALSRVIRGPFRALGITREQLQQCHEAGALLVDYVFTGCTIPDGAVKIHNLAITETSTPSWNYRKPTTK